KGRGNEPNVATRARADGKRCGTINGERENKARIVVRVISEQFEPAGRGDDARRGCTEVTQEQLARDTVGTGRLHERRHSRPTGPACRTASPVQSPSPSGRPGRASSERVSPGSNGYRCRDDARPSLRRVRRH